MADKTKNSSVVKLNIGCGGRPLPGYINIDSDNLLTLQARYPNQAFSSDLEIVNYDIMNLPFEKNTVDEVRADSLIEHLSFSEEPHFFYEVRRVLRPGGKFDFSTTNFEKIVKLWINAVDDWKEFYRTDDEAIEKEHWFGQYSYSTENRWGYLSAMIFGSQNGAGQFHKNCYTIGKLRAILDHLCFEEVEISESRWKGNRDPMIHVVAKKQNA
jgi:predicted SAM-dependent methyltransferase